MAGESHLHQLDFFKKAAVDKYQLLKHSLDSTLPPPKPSVWRHNRQAPDRCKRYTAPIHKEFFSFTYVPKGELAFAFGGLGGGKDGRFNIASLLDMRSLEWTQLEPKVRAKGWAKRACVRSVRCVAGGWARARKTGGGLGAPPSPPPPPPPLSRPCLNLRPTLPLTPGSEGPRRSQQAHGDVGRRPLHMDSRRRGKNRAIPRTAVLLTR
jgi:hypothetical protein